MNDQHDIALKVRSGDEQAFEHVFRKHYAGMCGYAAKYLRDMDQAEEVVQDVFLTYWDKRTTLEIAGSLEAYLYRAVRNSSLNQLKHVKVRQHYIISRTSALRLEESRVPDKVVELELQQKIDGCIEDLPPERKRIFKMSREEGLKYKEIAAKLDLSVKTVEAQMGKALKYLRENLAEYLPVVLLFSIMKTFYHWWEKLF